MDLKEWAARRGNKSLLASYLNVSLSFVTRMLNGERKAPVSMLPEIHRLTGVHPKYIRPDIWDIMNVE